MHKTYKLPIRSVSRKSKVRPFNVQKNCLTIAAQTVSPNKENVLSNTLNSPEAAEHSLDSELTLFYSHHNITPAIREFHDDEDGIDLIPSQFSDVKVDIIKETELKGFTQAL